MMHTTTTTPVSNTPPDPPGSGNGRRGSPRLGDFGKLHSQQSSLFAMTPRTSNSATVTPLGLRDSNKQPRPSNTSPKTLALGNFSRIYDQLDAISHDVLPDVPDTPCPRGKAQVLGDELKKKIPSATLTRPVAGNKAPAIDLYSSDESTETALVSDLEHNTTAYSTPASSAPSSLGRDPSPLANFAVSKQKAEAKKSGSKTQSPTRKRAVKSTLRGGKQMTQIFRYQTSTSCPLIPVYDHVQSRDAKHESLSYKLIDQRVSDKIMGLETPEVVPNGVHVFIDMSNIIIGFQKALRVRYSLSESVRFSPLPVLDLSFLHELLVRDRSVRALNVGCSTRPDKPEPQYVQDLCDLGYRVDLRYRRPDRDLQADPPSSDDDGRGTGTGRGAVYPGGPTRYVEDMVDETLQIRIGESVMQHFAEPGTLVLATGDARPAKFSDGFFAYAERALKMGWNVEVVSWRSSLSNAWTSRAWAEQWGSRLRVIELDAYLDEMFACYGP